MPGRPRATAAAAARAIWSQAPPLRQPPRQPPSSMLRASHTAPPAPPPCRPTPPPAVHPRQRRRQQWQQQAAARPRPRSSDAALQPASRPQGARAPRGAGPAADARAHTLQPQHRASRGADRVRRQLALAAQQHDHRRGPGWRLGARPGDHVCARRRALPPRRLLRPLRPLPLLQIPAQADRQLPPRGLHHAHRRVRRHRGAAALRGARVPAAPARQGAQPRHHPRDPLALARAHAPRVYCAAGGARGARARDGALVPRDQELAREQRAGPRAVGGWDRGPAPGQHADGRHPAGGPLLLRHLLVGAILLHACCMLLQAHPWRCMVLHAAACAPMALHERRMAAAWCRMGLSAAAAPITTHFTHARTSHTHLSHANAHAGSSARR